MINFKYSKNAHFTLKGNELLIFSLYDSGIKLMDDEYTQRKLDHRETH